MITNKDLYNNIYSITELEENIENLGLWDILLTQYLTADFCFTALIFRTKLFYYLL